MTERKTETERERPQTEERMTEDEEERDLARVGAAESRPRRQSEEAARGPSAQGARKTPAE